MGASLVDYVTNEINTILSYTAEDWLGAFVFFSWTLFVLWTILGGFVRLRNALRKQEVTYFQSVVGKK